MSTSGTDDRRQRLEQIRNVLRLETRKGYMDTSAVNGVATFAGDRLAGMAATLRGNSRKQVEELERQLGMYGSMDPHRRVAVVGDALLVLDEILERLQSAPPKPANPEPARSRSAPPKRPPVASKPAAPARSKPATIGLADAVTLLPTVGPGRAKQLEQLGVKTVRDLIYLLPRRHVDYGNVEKIGSLLFGRMSTVQGVVQQVNANPTRGGRTIIDVVVADETGAIHAIFFNPWVEKQLVPGTPVSLSGRIEQRRGMLCLNSPEWEILSEETLHTGRIVPVYPLTKGLHQKTLRTLVRIALDRGLHLVTEHLPGRTLQRAGVIGIREALEWIHFPEGSTPDEARVRLHRARSRLAFDELLLMQIGLLQRKHQWQAEPGNAIRIDQQAMSTLMRALPFALTGAQQRALGEILDDMASELPMTRLLQGDVGSGKTAVAAAAGLAAIRDGYQVAVMAPTELLAEQHMRSFGRLYENLPEDLRPAIALLTGSTRAAARREIAAGLEAGEIDLLVGTQALIQEGVTFARLGLAVVDEQHRFGVAQRAMLREKGNNPDLLVMTATPIPRSLALTIHGDLDVSTLDELPPGRQPIETHWIQASQARRAYEFVRKQVEAGRQAFIVFPLVEESEMIDAKAAVDEHQRLSQEVFPDLNVGLLHGRMKPAEKDDVMIRFRDGEIDILVSTSVVEVGIDVPNATVMLIEGAERFGLAQLHQFRGRVGRGSEKSYCLLVSGDSGGDVRTRLQAMVDTQDGFRLAQIDLELRGPGDFLGTRQSGLPELRLADLADMRDIDRARSEARAILDDDPMLERAEHAFLAGKVEAFWSSMVADVS